MPKYEGGQYRKIEKIDSNPSWISERDENGQRNCFKINLHKSMEPGSDRMRHPWICSQTRICSETRYQLGYTAQCTRVLNIW